MCVNMAKQPIDRLALLEERARYLANHDPDFNNMTLRKYLDGFSPEEREKEIESLRSVGELSPVNEGFLTETGQSIGLALLKAGRGWGSTIEELSGDTGVREYFEEAMRTRQHWRPDKNYTPLSFNPGNIGRTIGSAIGSTAAPLVAGVATTVATGNPMAGAAATGTVTFATLFGDEVKEFRQNMPNQDESTIKGLAFLSATGQSLIESVLGPERLAVGLTKQIVTQSLKDTTKGLVKTIGKEAAKNAIAEGSEEVAQDMWSRIVQRMGTENVALPSWREVAENFAGGAWGGAALGGIGGVIEYRGKSRNNTTPSNTTTEQKVTEPVAQSVANEQNALADVPESAVAGVEPPAVIDAPKAIPENISPELNREYSTGLRLAEGVAKDLGLNIRYFDEIDNPNDSQDAARANGWYDAEKNEIWLNRQNPEINPAETLGHELKHFINKKHPELAEKFDALFSAGMTDVGRAELNNIESQYTDAGFAPGQGKMEFSADTFGKMWTDPEFLRRFSEQAEAMEKGLGEKVLAAIQEFIEMVRKQLKNIGTREAETWFNNFGELRDEAVNMAVAIRRMNGNSTQAENVVSATGSSNVQSIPLADLQIDPQRFQFKSKADKITGVDESNQIGGEWDPRSAAILYVWEDKQGNKFVVNGHHRFALAKEKNIDKVNAIVDREANGVTAEQARRNGILINIRDSQGDVQDYAEFVRNDNMSEETARKEGILSREKGRSGYIIGHYATDLLYDQFKAGDVSVTKAEVIADIARGDEALEAAGLRAVKNNMPVQQLREFLRVLKNTPRVENQTEQGDLFGFDDSAIKTAETLSKLAAKHIKAIAEKVKASKNAIKNPEAAKALQVKVGKDSEKLYNEALKEQQEWQNWYTNERIYNQLLQEAGLTEQQNSPVDAAENNAPQSPDNNGRFNIDSDTPLLTPEEDANDFQLVGETSKDIARREVRERQEELAAQKRRELEARMATPDLDFEGKDSMATADNTSLDKKKSNVKIDDFGEKIGGARKDTAKPTGRRVNANPDGDNLTAIDRMYDVVPHRYGGWAVRRKRDNRTIGQYDSEGEAKENLFRTAVEDNFVVRSGENGKYDIYRYRKSTNNVLLESGFDSRDAAEKYILDNFEDLIKRRTSFGEQDIATAENPRRIGIERRHGDVTPEMFSNAFGFRGTEFGKWENQQDRQNNLNQAYDALYDLAELLDIPPRAVSLNGTLGAAFGARGHGGSARAHYEPSYTVFNLSKPKGAGSLAHEWMHALDNYFGRQNMGESARREMLSDNTYSRNARKELVDAFENITNAMTKKQRAMTEQELSAQQQSINSMREAIRKQLAELRNRLAHQSQYNRYSKRKKKDATPEQLKIFDRIVKKLDSEIPRWGRAESETINGYHYISKPFEELNTLYKEITGRTGYPTSEQTGRVLDDLAWHVKKMLEEEAKLKASTDNLISVDTEFYRKAKKLDATRTEQYWSAPTEMLARAFSSFIEDKLASQGRLSEYLSYGSDNNLYPQLMVAFPQGEERTAINQAFQKFFDVMKHETLPNGNVRLYSLKRPTDNIPIEKKQFSLKKNKQVNPIREDGATKEEYQRQLDNYMYDPVVRQQVDAEADNFIQRNGGEQAVIGLLAGGDFIPGNVHGMAVMQKLLNSKTFATSDAETKNILSDQYMQLGTRLGQMLNARRLGALTLSSRESIQAHINAALVKIDQKKPGNNVRKQIEENTGVNPDALPDDIIDTPEKVDHIGRILGANMASIGDKLYEYWINSILSGPSTHAANILGNTINATYELTGKRFTEALINTVTKRKDGATFGEFKTMLQHLDFKEAWRRAKRAWDLETTGNGGKLETMRTAIGGRTGRIIRMPGRALRAADEFAKAVIYPIETAAMAYREGIAKGLSGQELSSYIEEQLTTPNSTAAKWGNQRAAELTFTEDPGAAIRKMMEMREAGGWFGTALKMFFPFMKTPHNILKQGIRKSPLGVLSLLNEGGKIIRGKRDFDGEFVARTAEQVLAWSALALIYGLDDDDDLPFITGSSPRYGSAEQQFKANKIPPYSIRIGDTYYSYRRIEPLATGLALIADTVQALKDSDNGRDATQISKKLFNSAKQIIVEKSFLDSLGEISRVANDPEYSMVNWGTNFAASWVPNVARQTIQAFDDNVRDYKNRAKGEEFFEEQFKILIGRTGLVKAAPKIDYFGREITKDTLAGAAPLSKLMRLIPIQAITPDENMNRAELLMWRYNQLNPDEPYYPAVPAYYFTRDGKKLYFSGDNYTDYATESGQLALKQINNAFRHGLLDENNPTKEDIELIKKIFSRARQTVKDKMYRQGRYSE